MGISEFIQKFFSDEGLDNPEIKEFFSGTLRHCNIRAGEFEVTLLSEEIISLIETAYELGRDSNSRY